MKRLPLVILALGIVLVAVVAGCGRTPRYDGRLVAADSLMRSVPDSALAIVEGVCHDSLAAQGDRAYHDLLLTQARYRCYITATSDSDINRALAYYRAHPKEREKLTRAYIYKGAVMEELDRPDSAMFYYKSAEAVAAPDDYFNLGYVNLRMGALLRDHNSRDGKQIVKFEKALEYFNKTDHIGYQLKCMVNLGSLCCLYSPQRADTLLNKALYVAQMTGDTVQMLQAYQNLIKKDIHLKEYEDARRLAQKVLALNTQRMDAAFYIYAADAYACLQMPDSAAMLLAMAEEKSIAKGIDRLAYLDVLRDIALARGDLTSSHYYGKLADSIENAINSAGVPFKIMKIEDDIDVESNETILKQQHSLLWKISLLMVTALALLALAALFFFKKHRYKRLATELSESHAAQYDELMALQERIKALDIRDSELKEFIASNFTMMREMIDKCHHGASIRQIKDEIDKIVRFQKGNSRQWSKLFSYIDMEYGNIISVTRNSYPHLNEKDLMLLALTTLDCSCVQIATILGYSNASSVGPIRQRLAGKMNLDGTLNQYIQQFKNA